MIQSMAEHPTFTPTRDAAASQMAGATFRTGSNEEHR